MGEQPVDEGDRTRAEREAAFHDHRFARDGGARPASRAEFARRIDRTTPPARVLELGCGPNSAAWDLIERGLDVVGIDISEEAIKLTRALATERGVDPTAFVPMDAEQLEFPDASFDLVIGSSILHHLDLGRALSELRRVLAPGGRAVFYEPSGHNPAINLYRRATPSQRSADERPLGIADLDLIRSTFDETDVEYFHLASLASLPLLRTRAFDMASGRLERADRRLLGQRSPLRRFAWVLVIEGRLHAAADGSDVAGRG